MPDLDNLGFKVQGRWKRALKVASAEPSATATLAQEIAAILSRCITQVAGVRALPCLAEQLVEIANRPFHERETCQVKLPREHVQEGSIALRAATQVLMDLRDPMLTYGPADVSSALSRRFLEEVAESNFFRRIDGKTLTAIYGNEENGRRTLLDCRRDLQSYLDGLSKEFAEGFWEARLTAIPYPKVAKRDTSALLEQEVSISLDDADDHEAQP